MPRKIPEQSALFVRLPAAAAARLDRAAEALRVPKKDLITGLVAAYVDPDSPRALGALGALATRNVPAGRPGEGSMGSYSFQSYDPPEVLNAGQAGEFLQVTEATVVELAEAGKLPGRKLGDAWRFSRAALVAWLSTSSTP